MNKDILENIVLIVALLCVLSFIGMIGFGILALVLGGWFAYGCVVCVLVFGITSIIITFLD